MPERTGAIVLRDGSDYIVIDSIARKPFMLADGERFVYPAPMKPKEWWREGDTLLQTPEGPLHRLDDADITMQWARQYRLTKKVELKKELIVFFRYAPFHV
ncbi:MAG: hypothetical protein M1826_006164 [Phylliscum demangeonii]|nr:MAG: hypothetical protein M1826_006164 [Phylliscum demangeonii]